MVDLNYISKVLRELELYYINNNNNKLDGSTYSLILFIPVIRFEGNYKYNLILSASKFDRYSRKEIISNIFKWLNDRLNSNELEKIESIVVANSNSPFVKDLNFIIPIKEGIKELDNISVGGVEIHYGILIYSNLLKKLKPGNAIAVELMDSRLINMGIHEIDDNLNISFYTGKGLRELFAPNRDDNKKLAAKEIMDKGIDYLMNNSYYDKINISEIKEVK